MLDPRYESNPHYYSLFGTGGIPKSGIHKHRVTSSLGQLPSARSCGLSSRLRSYVGRVRNPRIFRSTDTRSWCLTGVADELYHWPAFVRAVIIGRTYMWH